MSGGDLRHRVSGSMFGSRKQPEDGYGEGLDEKHALELAKQKMDEIGFKKAKEKLKLQMVIFLEDQLMTAIMIAATLFALYGVELWEAWPWGPPPIELDWIIYSCSLVVFLMFLLEFAILSWAKPDYGFSFFFWLDLLAAVSLLPDVMMLFKYDLWSTLIVADGGLTMARAGRAARAGTRALRIVRVIKLLTLARKARKVAKGALRQEEDSMIGGRLADGITQKVIIIVGMMLFTTSLLDLLSAVTDADYSTSLRTMESLYLRCGGGPGIKGCRGAKKACLPGVATDDPVCHFNMYFRGLVVEHNGDFGGMCAYIDAQSSPEELRACNFKAFDEHYDFERYEWGLECGKMSIRWLRIFDNDLFCMKEATYSLRTSPEEKVSICYSSTGKGCTDHKESSEIIFSNVRYAQGQAIVNILQVTFIILLLGVSSFLFQKDADKLVIRPLSKMARLVQNLSANPLAKIEESEGGEYETDFVERALKKFGKLLQIAFGEAGSEIIGKNLGVDGDLNPMIAGRKMSAIFGFAIVRNFTDCTECLQEDVMVFVNTIAGIVHRAVKDNQGAPNKNIGEAFLMAWRLPDGADISQPSGTVADSALKSFVRACLEVQASEDLRKMTEHPKIQERLPGYRVTMGFGLHVGWAIEGAIGSMLKIDASYLSPNVNMAARLESGTHQFHVDILMSDTFYSMLSRGVKQLCRRIDRVTVKGSVQPMSLYTYDVPPCTANTIDELAFEDGMDFWEHFKPRTTQAYRENYAHAVQKYLDGNWGEAGDEISICLQEWPEDGPASVLLEVMEKHDFVTPKDWRGYRELINK